MAINFAKNIGNGWGNVIKITHYHSKDDKIESLYAHCKEILVEKGEYVIKGQKIATIGNNDGQYLAHLHFELRGEVGMPIGSGYSKNIEGYLNPSKFIQENR